MFRTADVNRHILMTLDEAGPAGGGAPATEHGTDAAALPVVEQYTRADLDAAVQQAVNDTAARYQDYDQIREQLTQTQAQHTATMRELVAATTGVAVDLLPQGPDVTREALEQAAQTANQWLTQRAAAAAPAAAPRPATPTSPLQTSSGEPMTPQQKAAVALRRIYGR